MSRTSQLSLCTFLYDWQSHRIHITIYQKRHRSYDNVYQRWDQAFQTINRCLSCTFHTSLESCSSLFLSQWPQWISLQTSRLSDHVLDASYCLSLQNWIQLRPRSQTGCRELAHPSNNHLLQPCRAVLLDRSRSKSYVGTDEWFFPWKLGMMSERNLLQLCFWNLFEEYKPICKEALDPYRLMHYSGQKVIEQVAEPVHQVWRKHYHLLGSLGASLTRR